MSMKSMVWFTAPCLAVAGLMLASLQSADQSASKAPRVASADAYLVDARFSQPAPTWEPFDFAAAWGQNEVPDSTLVTIYPLDDAGDGDGRDGQTCSGTFNVGASFGDPIIGGGGVSGVSLAAARDRLDMDRQDARNQHKSCLANVSNQYKVCMRDCMRDLNDQLRALCPDP